MCKWGKPDRVLVNSACAIVFGLCQVNLHQSEESSTTNITSDVKRFSCQHYWYSWISVYLKNGTVLAMRDIYM